MISIIFMLFVILMIILVNYLMLMKSPISDFPAAQNNNWIGFWGSLLGGLIGGIVVLLTFRKTIDYYRTKDEASINLEKAKIRLNFRPYFRMSFADKYDSSISSDESIYFFHGSEFTANWESMFLIENIGLGTAIEVEFTYFDTIKNPYYHEAGSSILIGEKRYIKFHVDQEHKTYLGIHHFMRLEYKDLLGNEYYQILVFVSSPHGGEVTYCAHHCDKPTLINSVD